MADLYTQSASSEPHCLHKGQCFHWFVYVYFILMIKVQAQPKAASTAATCHVMRNLVFLTLTLLHVACHVVMTTRFLRQVSSIQKDILVPCVLSTVFFCLFKIFLGLFGPLLIGQLKNGWEWEREGRNDSKGQRGEIKLRVAAAGTQHLYTGCPLYQAELPGRPVCYLQFVKLFYCDCFPDFSCSVTSGSKLYMFQMTLVYD